MCTGSSTHHLLLRAKHHLLSGDLLSRGGVYSRRRGGCESPGPPGWSHQA